ncbi:MAG: cell division protein FtsL, partial [Pseudomonadota bacterium]
MVSGATTIRAGIPRRDLLWVNVVLTAMVLLSTFLIIHSTHACRAMYAQLQELESSQWYLQEHHSQLLLEHSTWASHYRVEQVAMQELAMQPPSMD